ncbi:MAG: FHA domain-containing protein [Acidobacteria bacterium]|nr:FHA domain-containing protein [Acidobacteriota bacterium]MCI0626689.1 FHA domain-containing protein [Acidobacteriota bacterium]MCI0721368.1 FHA domain-containing protein [Acidobacteriota bacterium]
MEEKKRDSLVKGQHIIAEIVRNMLEGREPLQYTTLVPSLYYVYLHTNDYKRLEGILPRIIEEAKRALAEELERMKQNAEPPRILQNLGLSKKNPMQFVSAQEGWFIAFYESVDEETQPGDIVIDSELALPPKTEYSSGLKTKRITTRLKGGKATSTQRYEDSETRRERVYANITYEDNSGQQVYLMTKDQIVVGRGGKDYWVDLKLQTLPDVSREHIRLRWDERSHQFYIKDLSRLGTTVNGKPIPSSIETGEEQKRDKNIEVLLPAQACIGLAGVVFLNFESASGL